METVQRGFAALAMGWFGPEGIAPRKTVPRRCCHQPAITFTRNSRLTPMSSRLFSDRASASSIVHCITSDGSDCRLTQRGLGNATLATGCDLAGPAHYELDVDAKLPPLPFCLHLGGEAPMCATYKQSPIWRGAPAQKRQSTTKLDAAQEIAMIGKP